MSLFGAIGDFLGGGGGPKGYTPKNTDEVNKQAQIYNTNALGKNGGAPISAAMANAGYNYSPLNTATAGYGAGANKNAISATYNPANITANYSSPYSTSTYTPTNQNYQTLPGQYYKSAYGSGAANINQATQGAVNQATEAIGPRNIGAVNAAASNATRAGQQQLGALSQSLGQQEMQQGVQTGIQQQQANEANRQFGANYNESSKQFGAGQKQQEYQSQLAKQQANAEQQKQAYDSQFAKQSGNAGLNLQYLSGLANTGASKIGLQQAATGAANNEEIQRQNSFNSYLQSLMNAQNAAAGVQQQGQGGALGFLGGAASIAAPIAASFCLPKGTLIEDGIEGLKVEDIIPGDIVSGGKVIAISRRLRPAGHSFYFHQFDTGSVTMSKGHPYFDNLDHMEPISSDSDCTYDILTDSGHYWVNGVKLGSTISI